MNVDSPKAYTISDVDSIAEMTTPYGHQFSNSIPMRASILHWLAANRGKPPQCWYGLPTAIAQWRYCVTPPSCGDIATAHLRAVFIKRHIAYPM
jgi:hypothetical protein